MSEATTVPSDNAQPAAAEGDGLFIAWTRFQRRPTVLAEKLGLELRFIYLPWEGNSRLAKVMSYLVKAYQTVALLVQRRPRFLILQLPPTPALYLCAFYTRLARIPLIVDCHNSAIMEHWSRWPLTARLFKRAVVVVHNDHIAKLAVNTFGVDPLVLRTGIMSPQQSLSQSRVARERFGLSNRDYVLLPWSLHVDEPMKEAFDAIRQLPDLPFVLTGDTRKLPASLSGDLPDNLTTTGYLATEEFSELFAHAAAVVVLTTRDNTQLSGMAEAMAFEVPAVISDTTTTRYLYGVAPIYVANEPDAIRAGIEQALQTSDERVIELRALRQRTEAEFEGQVLSLLQAISAARL